MRWSILSEYAQDDYVLENTLVCDLEASNDKEERVMSGLAQIIIKR